MVKSNISERDKLSTKYSANNNNDNIEEIKKLKFWFEKYIKRLETKYKNMENIKKFTIIKIYNKITFLL